MNPTRSPATRPSPPAMSAVAAIDTIAGPVAERIDLLLEDETRRWSRLDVSLSDPLSSLRAMVANGGKRLRPAFCYWAFVAAGGDANDEKVVDAGAALELLHSFALVHDDVMDDSVRRRGRDAVHVEFAKRHTGNGWRGEHRRFGEGVAILVGDMAFVYADLLMAGAPRPATDVFNEMRIELNVGQYLDVFGTVVNDVSLAAAERIACYKSGKYTVERPMHLGAALAGRLDDLGTTFTGYGVPVGEAFQFRDDILGCFGDAVATGKPTGIDIREGKPTALAALARRRADDAQRRVLDRYGADDLTEAEVFDLQQVMTETGARREMDEMIDERVANGIAALEDIELVGASKSVLTELAYFVAGRQH